MKIPSPKIFTSQSPKRGKVSNTTASLKDKVISYEREYQPQRPKLVSREDPNAAHKSLARISTHFITAKKLKSEGEDINPVNIQGITHKGEVP